MPEKTPDEYDPKAKYPGISVRRDGDTVVVNIPVRFYRRNGRQMVLTKEGKAAQTKGGRSGPSALVLAIAKAYAWQEDFETGDYASLGDFAKTNGLDRTYVSRMLRLTSLAPQIVEAILDGNEPEGMSLRKLRGNWPLSWAEQEKKWPSPKKTPE